MKKLSILAITVCLCINAGLAVGETYTRANFPEDHFIWTYYPPDASYDDLIHNAKGCYFYIYDDAAHPLTDSKDKQICQDSSGNFGKYAAPHPRF